MSEETTGAGNAGGNAGGDGTPPTAHDDDHHAEPMTATITGKAERPAIPASGGTANIDYRLQVSEPPARKAEAPQAEHKPLALSVVLDRSGSMGGGKLDTAKYATSAVLDRLDERDLVAVTVFDDRIDLIQPLAKVTPELKESLRAELARVQPRGGTALFGGWQLGANVLTERKATIGDRLAHCFLLTDGQANEGETDPERIAVEVGKLQESHGVGTSTFGIGAGYAEELLGPMAVAGGGQFHHLEEPGEIARMFVTQLGDLLAVALPRVKLELDIPAGVTAQVVNAYWAHPDAADGGRVTSVGDLLAGEQRSIVYALTFPAGTVGDQVKVRARLVWATESGEQSSAWDEVTLTYKTDDEFARIAPAPEVALNARMAFASSRTLSAMASFKQTNDVDMLMESVDQSIQALEADRGPDGSLAPELQAMRDELIDLRQQLASGTHISQTLKRAYMATMHTSRHSRPSRAWDATPPTGQAGTPPKATPAKDADTPDAAAPGDTPPESDQS